jgi:hypothetical protein
MFRMSTAALRIILQRLRQAARDHRARYANLIRTIVYRLPCDPRELAERAAADDLWKRRKGLVSAASARSARRR